jgi:hypothetical protein
MFAFGFQHQCKGGNPGQLRVFNTRREWFGFQFVKMGFGTLIRLPFVLSPFGFAELRIQRADLTARFFDVIGCTWGDEKEVLKVPKLISLRSERSLIPVLFRYLKNNKLTIF